MNKKEKLYHGMTNIDEDILEEAAAERAGSGLRKASGWRRHVVRVGAMAAMLAVAVLCGVLLWRGGGQGGGTASGESGGGSNVVSGGEGDNGNSGGSGGVSGNESSGVSGEGTGVNALRACALAAPTYPSMAPYPDSTGEWDDKAYNSWWESRWHQRDQERDYVGGLKSFCAETVPEFLSDGTDKNKVYSPLNIYLALGMLTELTDGDSRAQILKLLDVDTVETLRTRAAALWNANYCDDGVLTSVLASSLWLNNKISFNHSVLQTLADTYYASSFEGEMGLAKFNQLLQSWLNEQTHGLLTEQASEIEFNPQTVLALATTVYFNAKWSHEFQEGLTKEGVFHAPDGDTACNFMSQKTESLYCRGEKFSAVSRSFETGGGMWFFLPDEGVDVETLLSDPETISLMFSGGEWENSRYLMVNQTVPKFDVSGSLDLIGGLQRLGITDVFDPDISDFSPMTSDLDEIYVSQATHAARVKLDEKGVEAAAFTVITADAAGAMPEEEIDFVIDRPFLFTINGLDGTPLFIGVVNNPNG